MALAEAPQAIEARELRIVPPNSDLIVEAVQVPPHEVHHFRVTLSADGIELPYSLRSPEQEYIEYIENCRRRGIVPFVHHRFHFTERSQRFYQPAHRRDESLSIPFNLSHRYYLEAHKELIRGGRPHRLSYSAEVIEYPEAGYEQFRTELLPELMDSGYQIDGAELWFASRYSRGCCEVEGGYDPSVSLRATENRYFNRRNLWLNISEGAFYGDDKESAEVAVKVRGWFGWLAEQHGLPIQVPTSPMFR